MEAKRFQTEWGGKTLTIESGKLAPQANGAVTVRYGDTLVLAAVTMGAKARANIDFFPLSFEYEEKMYASGKIKSSRFMKREGRPTDEAVMTGRMIDRALRPLFPHDVRHEVQIVVECLSADMENDTDIMSFVAAACALHVSDVPWDGPIAGIRVGRVDGKMIVNPTFEQRLKGDLDVILGGSPERVIMLEANSKEVSEADMHEAIRFGQKNLGVVIKLIEEVRAAIGKPKRDPLTLTGFTPEDWAKRTATLDLAKAFVKTNFPAVLAVPQKSKAERTAVMDKMKKELLESLKGQGTEEDMLTVADQAFYGLFEHEVSQAILDKQVRLDGRKMDETRPLDSEIGLLPRTHGSALFARGETHILSIVTLGSPGDVMLIDHMEASGKKRYIHHYNFPPYSVGETGRIGFTGRREIGHGGLAERALEPVLPAQEDFPYMMRVVSETMSSNGSSSQASICACSLALMDAGVPIKKAVAGVAMGLASDEAGRWQVLTDLQAVEDGEGGMDFKVGGTRDGINTIQLDTKTKGLTDEMVGKTLAMARDGRMHILDHMDKIIAAPRPELSKYAPRIETIKINPERIRDVIGPGGKVINDIIDKTGCEVNVENDGTVTVCSANLAGLQKAVQWIKSLTREVEAGEMFEEGKVVRIMDFGAFVEVVPGRDGMVHVSELAPWRVNKVTDVVNLGDIIPVKVIEIDDLGRINLSYKAAMAQLGREQKMPEGAMSRGGDDRGDRGGRGGGRPVQVIKVLPRTAPPAAPSVPTEPVAPKPPAGSDLLPPLDDLSF
jgi:polyribonucleotide nucleotidyltransferase